MTALLLCLIAALMEGVALVLVLCGVGLVWAIPVNPVALVPYGLVAAFVAFFLQTMEG